MTSCCFLYVNFLITATNCIVKNSSLDSNVFYLMPGVSYYNFVFQGLVLPRFDLSYSIELSMDLKVLSDIHSCNHLLLCYIKGPKTHCIPGYVFESPPPRNRCCLNPFQKPCIRKFSIAQWSRLYLLKEKPFPYQHCHM